LRVNRARRPPTTKPRGPSPHYLVPDSHRSSTGNLVSRSAHSGVLGVVEQLLTLRARLTVVLTEFLNQEVADGIPKCGDVAAHVNRFSTWSVPSLDCFQSIWGSPKPRATGRWQCRWLTLG